MTQSGAAYDLSRFEQTAPRVKPQQHQQPQLKVVKTSTRAKAKTKRMLAMFKVAFCAIALVTVAATVVYTRAVLTEVGESINMASKELKELKSENGRLAAELESKLSLRNVEEYATVNLGLSKIEQDQIEYVNLSEGDKIELAQTGEPNLLDKLEAWFDNVMAYITKK